MRCESRTNVFAQFDIPIGQIDEVLPAIVLMKGKIDLDERPPFGSFGFANQVHAGFLRSAVGLKRVALDARAHDILPGRGTTPVTRDDMIQIQVFAIARRATILTGILVSFKNVMAREFDFLLGHVVVHQQQDDAGYPQPKRHRAY